MKHPLVSVIIPVYNSEKTLKKCIDSILYQSFKDFELILVDDGSSDFSPTICDDYAAKDSRVRTFHKENGGVSSARNLGLDKAQGKWVAFIDSDDYVTDGYLDGVVGHDEDILFKGYKRFDNNGIAGGKEANDLSDIPFISDFISQNVTDSLLRGPVFKFYKRTLIGDLRFLADMKIGEDAWFVFNYLAKCSSFAVLPKGEYMVRLAEGPDEVKYAIPVDYAVQSLNYLRDAYEGLVQAHHIDRGIFLSYIGYFKRISQADWRHDKARWYDNLKVKAIYDYVWPVLSVKQKLRIIVARALKR